MGEPSRYNVSQKQAGLNKDGVLANKMGIKKQKDLDEAEALLLDDSYQHFFTLQEEKALNFNTELLFEIHRYFLSTLYNWAGKTRSVEISKGNHLFAPSKHIRQLLKEFDVWLAKNMPSGKDSKKTMADKLAIIHNELNAIHPFREGNGRTLRLFLDLIASHCGYEPINYSQSSKQDYIEACKAGMSQDHRKMQKIMSKGLKKRN